MARWTPEQVRTAAPDDAALRAARGLARPGPWSETGATDSLVWGKCQGSGKTPYQVSIDVLAPAYRCSCPSRKFPCKHALALLMLWAEGGDIADVSAPSDFADAWARDRADRADRASRSPRAGSAEAPPRAPDPEARAKSLAARLAAMDAGMADFATWLRDLARAGMAATRSQPLEFFDAAAARLVDAKCPALATEVRELPAVLYAGESWTGPTLSTLGRWWTITSAWQRRDTLTDDQLADLRVALGWSWASEEIRTGAPIADCWVVLGVQRSLSGRIDEQRTWLRGLGTGATVVLLDFAVAGQALPMPRVTGAGLVGQLVPYPGAPPHRALVLDELTPDIPRPFPAGGDIAAALATIADHRAANPLAVRTPLVLDAVTLTATHVHDASGAALPLANPDPRAALAATGGRPVTCFGEWSAAGFWPLTVVVDAEAVPCG